MNALYVSIASHEKIQKKWNFYIDQAKTLR